MWLRCLIFSNDWLCTADEETILADENIVTQLTSMGFNYLQCQKAAINTSNTGVEEAMNWLLAHMDDPGILRKSFLDLIYVFCFSEFLKAIHFGQTSTIPFPNNPKAQMISVHLLINQV